MTITNHILTNNIKINTAKVISNDILPKGTSIPGKTQTIKKITIHNTGLDDVKANNFHRSLKRENGLSNGRKASWHLCVDDIEIYQHVKFNQVVWHAGNSTGNNTSIGIECTQWTDKAKQEKTWLNAAHLTAILIKHYNLTINDVVQHNHWSGKDCPYYLRHNKHGFNWTWFISKVKYYLNNNTDTNTNTNKQEFEGTFKPYIIKVTADVLNVRSGPGTKYNITTTIKKNEAYTIVDSKSKWGKLKSGAGWICLDYTIKK